jgi:hypothetical protein
VGQFGALAPFGLLTFGGKPSPAEAAYRSMAASVRAFDVTEGTHVDGKLYATAIAIGSVRATLRHARNQRHPLLAVEMLPALERNFGLAPTLAASDGQRRREVAARKLIVRGSSHPALATALRVLLGDDYVDLVSLDGDAYPTDPTTTGAWQRPEVPSRFFTLLAGASTTTATFPYASLLGDGANLEVGDVVSVEPERFSRTEAVTITAVNNAATPKLATAAFVRTHDPGASIRTHAPAWQSTKRRFIVVVRPAAAVDNETRRRIDRLMQRVVRATTQWSVALESAPHQLGPFTVGQSPIGAVPIGIVSTV